jgi:hypothetical protein
METKGLKKATNIVAAATLLLVLALAAACSRPLDIEKLSKLPPPTYEQALALAKKVSFTYWTHIPGAWDPLMVHLFMPEERYYAATVEDLQRWVVARKVIYDYQNVSWRPSEPYRVVIKKILRGKYVGSIKLCRKLSCEEYIRIKFSSWLVPGRVEARVGRARFWREMNRLNRKFFHRVARFLVKYPEVYHLLNGDLFKDRLDNPPGAFRGPGGGSSILRTKEVIHRFSLPGVSSPEMKVGGSGCCPATSWAPRKDVFLIFPLTTWKRRAFLSCTAIRFFAIGQRGASRPTSSAGSMSSTSNPPPSPCTCTASTGGRPRLR